VTSVTEIVEVKTPEELEQIRDLFRSYQAELPAQLRFPDTEWQMLPGAYSPPAGTLLLAGTPVNQQAASD